MKVNIEERRLSFVIYFSLLCALVLSRFFLERGVNYDGSSSTLNTYIGYLIEDFGLALGGGVYIFRYFSVSRFDRSALIWMGLFFYVFISSIYSEDWVLSVHLSLRGVGYVLLGLLMVEYVYRAACPLTKLYSLLHALFFITVLSAFVEISSIVNWEYALSTGAGGSFYAIIGLLSIYVYFLQLDSVIASDGGMWKRFWLLMLIAISMFFVLRMNSLASILCFAISYAILIHWNIKFKQVLLFWVLGVLTLYLLLTALINADITIARKDLDTIMSGTGRFQTWGFCFDLLKEFKINPIGYGFMSDWVALKDASNLELKHSCHNSFLTLVLGLGGWGLLYYLLFVGFNVYALISSRSRSEGGQLMILFVISCLLFGNASPVYPGMPTILISVFILLFRVRKLSNEKNIDYSLRCRPL